MRCPFCQTNYSAQTRACAVCGGPLSGLNPPVSPSPSQKDAASTGPASPPPIPILPVGPVREILPAKPLLFAQKMREKEAPRIVSILWKDETESHPLFALENGGLQAWDAARDEWRLFPSRRTLRNPEATTCAANSPGCEVIATGHPSGQMHLQRLETRAAPAAWKCHTLALLEAHRGPVLSLSIAKTRLYSAARDGAVVLTLLDDLHIKRGAGWPSTVILDGLGALSCLAVSPDGRRLALGGDDGRVQMWLLSEDGTPARLDWSAGDNFSPVKSLTFAPNGNLLLSRGAQGVRLWAAQTGHCLQFISQSHDPISPAFAPDSRLLAHANAAGEVTLRDAWTGAMRNALPPVPGGVQALGFAPAPTPARETLLVVGGAQQILTWKVSF